jgi:predicted double-glycine peptidase
MEAMRLPAAGLASVNVNLTQQTQLTVRIIYDGGCGAASTIDVVNDTLS